MARYYRIEDRLYYVGVATKHIYSNEYNEVVQEMINHYSELNHNFVCMLNNYFIKREPIKNVEILSLQRKYFERMRMKFKAPFGCKSFVFLEYDKMVICKKI